MRRITSTYKRPQMLLSGSSVLVTPEGEISISKLYSKNRKTKQTEYLCLLCSTISMKLFYCVTKIEIEKSDDNDPVLIISSKSNEKDTIITRIIDDNNSDNSPYIATTIGWLQYLKNTLVNNDNIIRYSKKKLSTEKILIKKINNRSNNYYLVNGLPIGCIINSFVVYPPEHTIDIGVEKFNGPLGMVEGSNIRDIIIDNYQSGYNSNLIVYARSDSSEDDEDDENSNSFYESDSSFYESDEDTHDSEIVDISESITYGNTNDPPTAEYIEKVINNNNVTNEFDNGSDADQSDYSDI